MIYFVAKQKLVAFKMLNGMETFFVFATVLYEVMQAKNCLISSSKYFCKTKYL